MPHFQFRARDGSGRNQTGTQEAASPMALAQELRQRGWLILELKPAVLTEQIPLSVRLSPFSYLPPRSVDIEMSLNQLAVMLRSGVTLLQSLKTIAEQSDRRSMRMVWTRVSIAIQEGASLSDAMKVEKCFSPMVVQLIRVGEQTGALDLVTTRSSQMLEKRRLLKNQMLTAMAYPLVVAVAAIGVAIFMVVGVIPKLQTFLSALGRRLPPMTQMLVDVTNWFHASYGLILGALVALTVLVIVLYRLPPSRFQMDRYFLRVPLIGKVLRLSGTVTFSRSLAVLLKSGITLLDGLKTLEEMHGNRFLAWRVSRTREQVVSGGGLAEPLAYPNAYMPLLSQMVAVGESSGNMEETLEETSRFYEAVLAARIRWLSTIIEPVIIVVVGGIVGFVYISFFLALFSVGGGGGR